MSNQETQVGDYILKRQLGTGGFAKVMEALHIPTGEKVTIKIIDKQLIKEDPENLKRIKREIKILKLVKHKNIVKLYEVMESPIKLYLVTELCEGGDLFDFIVKQKKLTEVQACKYFQEIIDALEYLHSQCIAHRDIKPENILIDTINKSNPSIKIIDFGVSNSYSNDKNKFLSSFCGTAAYVAPEMHKGEQYYGVLTDVWSAGVVLYAMVYGYLPFCEENEEENINNIINGNYELDEGVSCEVKDLIKNCLNVDPIKRYDFKQIKEHPWFNIVKPNLRPGIIVGYNKIPFDDRVGELCRGYGYDVDKVRLSVVNNKYDRNSSIYYILLKKGMREGVESVSDMVSEKFLEYINDERNLVDMEDAVKKQKNENGLGNNKENIENNADNKNNLSKEVTNLDKDSINNTKYKINTDIHKSKISTNNSIDKKRLVERKVSNNIIKSSSIKYSLLNSNSKISNNSKNNTITTKHCPLKPKNSAKICDISNIKINKQKLFNNPEKEKSENKKTIDEKSFNRVNTKSAKFNKLTNKNTINKSKIINRNLKNSDYVSTLSKMLNGDNNNKVQQIISYIDIENETAKNDNQKENAKEVEIENEKFGNPKTTKSFILKLNDENKLKDQIDNMTINGKSKNSTIITVNSNIKNNNSIIKPKYKKSQSSKEVDSYYYMDNHTNKNKFIINTESNNENKRNSLKKYTTIKQENKNETIQEMKTLSNKKIKKLNDSLNDQIIELRKSLYYKYYNKNNQIQKENNDIKDKKYIKSKSLTKNSKINSDKKIFTSKFHKIEKTNSFKKPIIITQSKEKILKLANPKVKQRLELYEKDKRLIVLNNNQNNKTKMHRYHSFDKDKIINISNISYNNTVNNSNNSPFRKYRNTNNSIGQIKENSNILLNDKKEHTILRNRNSSVINASSYRIKIKKLTKNKTKLKYSKTNVNSVDSIIDYPK